MSDRAAIEWTDATWNPVTGCTKVSPGCDNCYAETLAERFRGTAGHYFEQGFDVQLRPDKLDQPLRWRKPRRVFVNSMSDLFHKDIPDEYVARVFAVMASAPRHTFQVLTKRPARMRSLLNASAFQQKVQRLIPGVGNDPYIGKHFHTWPLPNVWIGVSTETQEWADIRIPQLLDTPAAVRFISAEPLIGPVDIFRSALIDREPGLDWVIVGGESGRNARPMHPAWVRTLRDECVSAGIPFHFKQWGEWTPERGHRFSDFHQFDDNPSSFMMRVGKKVAGRVLDGRTWDQQPAVAS